MKKVEEIRNSESKSKSIEYLALCNEYEMSISEVLKVKSDLGFICKKFAEEVSLSFAKAQAGDCEYTVYAEAFRCESYYDQFIQHSSKY